MEATVANREFRPFPVQNEAATPAATVDALSNKLITLTRRFYPSEVALPLRELFHHATPFLQPY